jgi:hypothetical protein
MKNWYLLVHWDSIYVTGFLAIGQPDEESARKAVIHDLVGKKIDLVQRAVGYAKVGKHHLVADMTPGINRVKALIKALNHPWRYTKEVFAHPSGPTIRYIELKNEVIDAGYWLEEVRSGEHYCNLRRYRTQDPETSSCSTEEASC